MCTRNKRLTVSAIKAFLLVMVLASCAGTPGSKLQSSDPVPRGPGSLLPPEYEKEQGFLYVTSYDSGAQSLEIAQKAARDRAREEAALSIKAEIESDFTVSTGNEIYSRLVQRARGEIEKLEVVAESHGTYQDAIGQTFFELYTVARIPWPAVAWQRTLDALERLDQESKHAGLGKRLAFLERAEEELGKIYGMARSSSGISNIIWSEQLEQERKNLPGALSPRVLPDELVGGVPVANPLILSWSDSQSPLPLGETIRLVMKDSTETVLAHWEGRVDSRGLCKIPLSKIPLVSSGVPAMEIHFPEYPELDPVPLGISITSPRVHLSIELKETRDGQEADQYTEGMKRAVEEALMGIGIRTSGAFPGEADMDLTLSLGSREVKEQDPLFVMLFPLELVLRLQGNEYIERSQVSVAAASRKQAEAIHLKRIAKTAAELLGGMLDDDK